MIELFLTAMGTLAIVLYGQARLAARDIRHNRALSSCTRTSRLVLGRNDGVMQAEQKPPRPRITPDPRSGREHTE